MKNLAWNKLKPTKKLSLLPLLLYVTLAVALPLANILVRPAITSAETIANTGPNIPQQLGQQCHDMQQTAAPPAGRGGGQTRPPGQWGDCVTWQAALNDALGCSDSMFVQK